MSTVQAVVLFFTEPHDGFFGSRPYRVMVWSVFYIAQRYLVRLESSSIAHYLQKLSKNSRISDLTSTDILGIRIHVSQWWLQGGLCEFCTFFLQFCSFLLEFCSFFLEFCTFFLEFCSSFLEFCSYFLEFCTFF